MQSAFLGKSLPLPDLNHAILRRGIQVSGRENSRKRRRQGEITLATESTKKIGNMAILFC